MKTTIENSSAASAEVTVSSEDATRAGGLHERIRSAFAAQLATFPRFVTERQPSLREHVAYAARGEWTDRGDGPARRLHLVYTKGFVIPVAVLAYAVLWAIARPGRFLPVLAVTVFVTTAANGIPVVSWFIPDWATLPYWPPVSWFV